MIPVQLDLFDWTPLEAPMTVAVASTGATIIPFPMRRNIGRARHVARLVLAREGRARDSYWRQVCNRLAKSLEASGLTGGQITHQLSDFGEAVATEMYCLSNPDARRQDPGGAA